MKWHRRLKPPTPQAKCIKLRQRVRKVRMGETQMPPQNLEVKKLLWQVLGQPLRWTPAPWMTLCPGALEPLPGSKLSSGTNGIPFRVTSACVGTQQSRSDIKGKAEVLGRIMLHFKCRASWWVGGPENGWLFCHWGSQGLFPNIKEKRVRAKEKKNKHWMSKNPQWPI